MSETVTLPTELNEWNVRFALQAAVEEYGHDWVDPNAYDNDCVNRYSYDNKVRYCIAALALKNLGFTDEFLDDADAGTAFAAVALGASDLGINHTPEASALLVLAQSRQDKGKPWGQCIPTSDAVDEYLGRR